ncbi:hypothetical protein B0H19DRAFT_1288372 [Mycena capillaripes]|nr:hypothetical protein B0H19DRAFT_1288372 [Mycena capillaripes]
MPRFNHGVQGDFQNSGGPRTLQAVLGEWETVSSGTLKAGSTRGGLPDTSATGFYRRDCDSSEFLVANWSLARATHSPHPDGYGLPAAQYSSASVHHVESDNFSGNRSQWIPIPFTSTPNIYTSTFFTAHGVEHIRRRREIGLDILRRATSFEPVSSPISACHPETRRDTLEILYRWVAETSGTGGILCLQGPEGVGKSAILRTLAQRLHAAGQLGATFVFRRQHSPGKNASIFFCIIAYQLAINIPHLRASISRTVRKNPGIFGAAMNVQFQELIIQPCREAMLSYPLILIIDGLDEFTYDVQREILCLLGSAVQNQPSPLRILFASRQERQSAEILAEPCFSGIWRSFNVERSLKDVRSYLRFELTRIQDVSFELARRVPWLSIQVLDTFVEASSGCFLYASTLIRFLDDARFSQRLAAVESLPPGHLNSSLDKLYTQILATIPTSSHKSLLALLHILATNSFAKLPVFHIEQLLHVKTGRLRRLLRHLRSVLNIPASDDGEISVHHASFLEFLIDPARSGAFCVSGAQHAIDLVRCILKALAYAHQNPHVNRVGHIAWKHLTVMVDYITSVYPSTDFLPLIQCINPDFFFGSLTTFQKVGGKILAWLNKICPRPAEVINVWEDYAYMTFFHSIVNDFDFDEGPDMFSVSELGAQRQILLRHPELIRLLRFSMVLPALTPLFQFRVLLGASWEELRTAVCALRPIFGRNDAALTQLWTFLQEPGFALAIYPWASVFRDLARQSIRIITAAYSTVAPVEVIGYWLEWGRYIRSSPPCAELLRELSSFVPRDDSQYNIATESEIYDVLKWLDSFPHVPRDERLRWERFLPEGSEFERECAYETRWTSWRALGWYQV